MLIMRDDDRLVLQPGEVVQERLVRFPLFIPGFLSPQPWLRSAAIR